MVLFWSELRKNTPRKIPSDFRMSTAAWQIAASRVGELPTPLLKKALLLYDHYQETNRLVAEYAETLDRLSPLPKGDPERKRLESHLNTILDVFNTGLDRSFELGKDVAEETVKIGRIREKKTPPRDFGADARELVAERQDRIRRLEGMDDH